MQKSSDKPFSFPVHDLPVKSRPVIVEKIAYSNAYDFSKKHRHRYFELLFFEKGGGSQLIDFEEYVVQDHACYIVQPNQIHLLKRNPKSHGFLMQFYAQSLSSVEMLRFLQTRGWNKQSGVVFENDPEKFNYYKNLSLFSTETDETNLFELERDRHIIQAFLFSLFANEPNQVSRDSHTSVIRGFLNAVEIHFVKEHSVQFYLQNLAISEKKLMEATKKHLGMTPLKVIHARLLLEAKRLLVFDDRAQKEVAYELGFDSPSNFSTFIKSRTGRTVSELQAELIGIHKE